MITGGFYMAVLTANLFKLIRAKYITKNTKNKYSTVITLSHELHDEDALSEGKSDDQDLETLQQTFVNRSFSRQGSNVFF